MSKLIWSTLKTSPLLLGAAVVVASSAQATQSSIERVVATQTATANRSKPTISVQLSDFPNNQLSSTQAILNSPSASQRVADPTQATRTSQVATSPKSSVESSRVWPENTGTQALVAQQVPTDTSTHFNLVDKPLPQQVPNADNSAAQMLQIQQYSGSGTDSLDQVTNVNQLSDVRPTDWAFEALRSLVERYGCIAGYPDGTFRGNRALSRYEFAAGVNACLQQIERLIASSTSDFVTKKDLETLQRLVEEFRTELTALGTRVDKLEGRVGFLEDHQFSTTTKLRGEAIFNVADMFGDQAGLSPARKPTVLNPNADYRNTETVAQYRARLNFDTSFTGKDLLRARLQAANITEFGPLRNNPDGNPPGTNITREGRFGFQADSGNRIDIERLYYRFPVGNLGQAFLFARGQTEDFVDLVNPGLDTAGTGALSRFGRFSPIYRMGGQGGPGAAVTIGGKSPIRVDLGYLADTGNNPNEKFGLFDGNYLALGQVTFQPTSRFRVAGTYVHVYDRSNLRHGEGSIASQIQTGRPVVGNSYGVEATFAFTPQLILSGWGNYTAARAIGLGDADIWSYGGTLSINDIGTKGSALGFVVGMEPKLTGTSNANLANQLVGLRAGGRRDRDTSLHIEGFYKFRVSPNILITPGVIWLTAPGHDSRNDDIFIGTIRTTFTF